MLPDLPREIQRSIMHIRRSEDATTIQRYWRGWRWRLWLDSTTMPFISSWHPFSTFLDATLFVTILAEGGGLDDEAETIRIELGDEVDRYRSLVKMAADHYGPERITLDALMEQIHEEGSWEDIGWMTRRLMKTMFALHSVPHEVICQVDGERPEDQFVRAVATLKAPVNKRRRLA